MFFIFLKAETSRPKRSVITKIKRTVYNNECFSPNRSRASSEKCGVDGGIAGVGLGWDVPEELISRCEAPTILDFLNKHVLIGADDGFREQCYIRNY